MVAAASQLQADQTKEWWAAAAAAVVVAYHPQVGQRSTSLVVAAEWYRYQKVVRISTSQLFVECHHLRVGRKATSKSELVVVEYRWKAVRTAM